MMTNFVSIDFETATPYRYSICAVGIAVFIKGVIVEKYFSLIKPPFNEFNNNQIKIHGIVSEMTNDQPDFSQIWEFIRPYFDETLIVSHNASFDIDVLNKTLEYYDIEVPQFKYDCTMNRFEGAKLKDLCKLYNIEIDHHDPLSDAVACGKIYLEFLKKVYNKDELEIIKPRPKSTGKTIWHKPIKGDVLIPDFENVFDKTNPFYMKKIVISGTYDFFERKEIANIIKDMGADIDTSVGKKTNILISGHNTGPSKLKKIKELNAEIINEQELIKIFNKYKMI